MKKFLVGFIIGLLLGTASYWTFRDGPLAKKVRESQIVQKVSDVVEDRTTSRLKEEMEKDGKIVVTKPADSNISTVEDSKLNDLVRAKLAIEPLLADAAIRQEVKAGEVTLRGTASSYDQVARAIKLALECGPAKSVVSTVEVKAK